MRMHLQQARAALIRRLLPLMDTIDKAVMEERRQIWLRSFGEVGKDCRIVGVDRLLNPDRIYLGSRIWMGPHLRLEAIQTYCGQEYDGRIEIGSDCSIGYYVHIGSAFSIMIEDGVTIGSQVTILDHDHGFRSLDVSVMRQPLSGSPVAIGKYCWIGKGATILKGVVLGDGCIVGANAVVTRSFPEGTIIGGVPARTIGQRQTR